MKVERTPRYVGAEQIESTLPRCIMKFYTVGSNGAGKTEDRMTGYTLDCESCEVSDLFIQGRDNMDIFEKTRIAAEDNCGVWRQVGRGQALPYWFFAAPEEP